MSPFRPIRGKCADKMRTALILQRARGAVVAPTLLAILASGCAAKHVEVWTPKPLVHWEHVSTQPVAPVSNGYRVLVDQPTHGLFPASLAVTRVAVEVPKGRVSTLRPYLHTDPRNELLQWNRALDDQMAVSEVFPIMGRDLGGGVADPEQVLAAFRALHARLGLIYAMNELSSTESEMLGVLYDAASARPIASFHTRAVSVAPPGQKHCRKPVDLWDTDSRALARAKFQRLVHTCIRDLILLDEPAPVKAPDGWTPAGPIYPVEWPPRRFRTGP